MKNRRYYETVSAIKCSNAAFDWAMGWGTNNSRIIHNVIRSKKRQYRSSRPKRTRCIYEN